MNSQPPVQPVSARFPTLEEQEIILTLFDPEAREVNVAGHFNGWHPIATPLKNMGAGKWVVRLMLRSGQHEYRFCSVYSLHCGTSLLSVANLPTEAQQGCRKRQFPCEHS
jgi:1,4-alpha-glucan branching enzyme